MFKTIIFFLLLVSFQLRSEVNVLAISGSLRNDSLNTKLVTEAAKMASAQGARVVIFSLKKNPLPFYDGDLEDSEGMPVSASRLREFFLSSDLVMISSPNYNGSMSGVLKNALDWVSRSEKKDYGKEPFQGKKFLLMCASPGKTGGAKGLCHLRECLQSLRANVVSEQFVLPLANSKFDENGRLNDPQVARQLYELVRKSL